MEAVQANDPSGIEPVAMPPFNSDAFIIRIDNHLSRCIDHCKKHFTDLKWTKSGTLAKGIAEVLKIKAYGTVHWNIADNHDQVHHLVIKQAAYIPDLPQALLSPQHWSQQANDNFPCFFGTKMEQYSDDRILYWDQWTFC